MFGLPILMVAAAGVPVVAAGRRLANAQRHHAAILTHSSAQVRQVSAQARIMSSALEWFAQLVAHSRQISAHSRQMCALWSDPRIMKSAQTPQICAQSNMIWICRASAWLPPFVRQCATVARQDRWQSRHAWMQASMGWLS